MADRNPYNPIERVREHQDETQIDEKESREDLEKRKKKDEEGADPIEERRERKDVKTQA